MVFTFKLDCENVLDHPPAVSSETCQDNIDFC